MYWFSLELRGNAELLDLGIDYVSDLYSWDAVSPFLPSELLLLT
jgi:hypothetical protein